MRFNPKGLKPTQLLAIYFFSAFLVIVNQVDGLAGWLEDIARSGQSRFHLMALDLAAGIRSKSEDSGLSKLNQVENKIVNSITPKWEVGGLSSGARRNPTIPVNLPSAAPRDENTATVIHLKPNSRRPERRDQATTSSTNNEVTGGVNAGGTGEDNTGDMVIIEAVNPSPIPASVENPPTIYDPGFQALAVPLKPKAPVGFKDTSPIRKILLTGDSMMIEGIGPPLERYFKSIEDLEVSREGRYSTGLCRLDFFDWFAFFKDVLETKRPDLVLITLGANDTQDIVVEGRKRHLVATPGWNEIYGQRVGQLLDLAAESGAKVLWLGLPIMGKEPYNTRVKNINEVTSTVCSQKDNCLFWDSSRSLTGKDGKYSSFLTVKDGRHVKVRAKDSIHLTDEGGKQMLADLLNDSPFLSARFLLNPASATAVQAPAAGMAPEEQPVAEAAESVAASTNPSVATTLAVVASAEATAPVTTVKVASGELTPPSGLLASQDIPPVGAAPAGPFILSETSLSSTNLGRTSYLVAVPQNAPAGPLPAVLLLHGAEGDRNYFVSGLGDDLLDLATRFGIILIMPDGGPFSWYLDSPLKDGAQTATYILYELLPDALARYPIDPERLALLGISMGGHGALTMALNNPGRFKAISTLSAVIDLESHKSDSKLDRYLKIHEVLGPPDLTHDVWRQYSAYYLTRRQSDALTGVPVRMSVGLADKLCLAENRQYNRLLTELGVEHLYIERSGGHDWALWKADFPSHMAFLAGYL
jgi:S-formylglutathione hydrolase FrmB/lysophospholipase L1-like esterase